MMQFLWKYIDDLVGKGLEWSIILELLFYASAHLVPMALPLAILVSSMMTLGNLAENNELMAFKSAGVSLLKILKALGIIIIVISIGAFFFTNYVLPVANLQFGGLLWDIKTKKPTFEIYEGVFYNGIDGFSIRIGEKSDNSKGIKDILIYDHTASSSNNIVIKADMGEMISAEDKNLIIIKLYDGYRYEEIRNVRESYRSFPHSRIKFKEYEMRFDLSSFDFSRTNISFFKDHNKMLNMQELGKKADSLENCLVSVSKRVRKMIKPYFYFYKESLIDTLTPNNTGFTNDTFIYNFPKEHRYKIINAAKMKSMTIKHLVENPGKQVENINRSLVRNNMEWHRKLTLSFSVLIVFLLGAPMGAIIRKGGLGMPTVVSIFLFIGYYIIFIVCEKLTKQFVLTPFLGMWLPIFILLPIGLFLVNKANKDSMLLNMEAYLRLLNIIKNFFSKKKL